MRVAVLSDIHGFSPALETVLADLDRTGPYDQIVVAGDLFEAGPRPDRVCELLMARGYPAVLGNTDEEIVQAADDPAVDPSTRYARDRIGADGLAWLSRLPFAHRVSPPDGDGPDDDLLIVHANPQNLYDRLDPAYSKSALDALIGGTRAAAIAFGHYHVCSVWYLDHRLLVDVSAVGNPKDGDLRCKYGVLTWNGAERRWQGELVRLPYPLDETEQVMRKSGMPNWEKAFRKLKRATYKPR